MNVFKKFRAMMRLWDAVRKADDAHAATGERYYVMPMNALDDKLIIFDRTNFRKIKRKGYIPKQANIIDLERECFYCTPYANGNGVLSPEQVNVKRKQYYAWLEAVYTVKKNTK